MGAKTRAKSARPKYPLAPFVALFDWRSLKMREMKRVLAAD
jgi:hypothetical protein